MRLYKRAWRDGYYGLSAVIAVAWSTQLSPGDVRSLRASQLARNGALSDRALAALEAYIGNLGPELHGEAHIFRNRSGASYCDTLGDDFRDVRRVLFGRGENRTLADFRRSGAVEAIAGEAKAEHLAHAMGNTLATSNALSRAKGSLEMARAAQGQGGSRHFVGQAGSDDRSQKPPAVRGSSPAAPPTFGPGDKPGVRSTKAMGSIPHDGRPRQYRSPQRHPLSERGNDCYPTAPEAVWALLAVETIPNIVWDPCCGPGNIVRELRRADRTVFASDLVDYGCPDSQSGVDFLLVWQAPPGVQCIVSNPPYKLGAHFVEHALRLCPVVVMLLRLAFLESERRTQILDNGKLARVRLFKRRLPMMHRLGWNGPKATSQVPYAWFVWKEGYTGPIVIDRIDTPDAPAFDVERDIRESAREGFRAIRERQASGDPAWKP